MIIKTVMMTILIIMIMMTIMIIVMIMISLDEMNRHNSNKINARKEHYQRN